MCSRALVECKAHSRRSKANALYLQSMLMHSKGTKRVCGALGKAKGRILRLHGVPMR